ncbi:replication-relaxation family protein [Streptomyces xiamenensis]|uniref:replication-relaxation family protein n=1 Tax=Streptomyces xiamenensis TaxID=408015 RepID=UPI0035DB947D
MGYRTSSLYPYGSTARLREDVLAALGVLKIATGQQITELVRPNAKSNKAIRNALLDLARHRLTTPDGYTRTPKGDLRLQPTVKAQKLWRLTPAGLQAAAEVLPAGTSSKSTARGAGRSGAPHAMLVNRLVIAFVRGGLDATTLGELCTVRDWQTEVQHPIAGRESVISDAVLRAPELGVPVLMVEADRSTMAPGRVAEKVSRYRAYYRRTIRLPGHRQKTPMWRLTYSDTGREGYPPVAFVLAGSGPRGLSQRMTAIENMTRAYWMGQPRQSWGPGHIDYTDTVPVIATTITRLEDHGPLGDSWRRFGRQQWQSLTKALDNPDGQQARQLPAWDEPSPGGVATA